MPSVRYDRAALGPVRAALRAPLGAASAPEGHSTEEKPTTMATTTVVHPAATTLRLAVVVRPMLVVDAVLVISGALLVALAAQVSIPLPFTPVPITGQTFAVVLVGSALGATLGTTSLALYLLAGIAGAPVYADQSSGWDIVSGPTGGYLVGFLLAAALTGWLAQRGWDKRFSSSTTAMLTANVVIFICGLVWLSHSLGTGLDKTLEFGLYPFVPGETLKLYAAGALLPGAWRLVHRWKR
jgi:biotin transport system substrate-specific component